MERSIELLCIGGLLVAAVRLVMSGSKEQGFDAAFRGVLCGMPHSRGCGILRLYNTLSAMSNRRSTDDPEYCGFCLKRSCRGECAVDVGVWHQKEIHESIYDNRHSREAKRERRDRSHGVRRDGTNSAA